MPNLKLINLRVTLMPLALSRCTTVRPLTDRIWQHLKRNHHFGVALRAVKDDELSRSLRVGRYNGIMEVSVPGAVVHGSAVRHGTRRTTEWMSRLCLVDTPECRSDNYHSLLAQHRPSLHKIWNNSNGRQQRFGIEPNSSLHCHP